MSTKNFLNIVDAGPCIRDLAPAPKPRGDPPVPPGQVDPPATPVLGKPAPNSGASSGSNWEPGKIPMDEERPNKLFSYRNPFYTKPSVPPPKVSNPIPPIPHPGLKAGKGELAGGDPSWSGGIPVDCSQGNPSLDKMPKQEASFQKVAKLTMPFQAP